MATRKKTIYSKVLAEEKKIEREEKKIEKKEKDINREEKRIETLEQNILFKIGKFKVTKKHAFDIAKIMGGSLLGTGIGLNVMSWYGDIAEGLSWGRIILMTVVSIFLAVILVYQEEKSDINKSKHPYKYVAKRVATIYMISLILVAVVTWLFTPEAPPIDLLLKLVFISSFSAVSGAITFGAF